MFFLSSKHELSFHADNPRIELNILGQNHLLDRKYQDFGCLMEDFGRTKKHKAEQELLRVLLGSLAEQMYLGRTNGYLGRTIDTLAEQKVLCCARAEQMRTSVT